MEINSIPVENEGPISNSSILNEMRKSEFITQISSKGNNSLNNNYKSHLEVKETINTEATIINMLLQIQTKMDKQNEELKNLINDHNKKVVRNEENLQNFKQKFNQFKDNFDRRLEVLEGNSSNTIQMNKNDINNHIINPILNQLKRECEELSQFFTKSLNEETKNIINLLDQNFSNISNERKEHNHRIEEQNLLNITNFKKEEYFSSTNFYNKDNYGVGDKNVNSFENQINNSGDRIEKDHLSISSKNLLKNTNSHILGQHLNIIWSVTQLSNNLVVSVSSDQKINTWDINKRKLFKSIPYKSPIYCVTKLSDESFAVGSEDSLIAIGNIYNENLLFLKGHEKFVWVIIKLTNGIIASGSGDNNILLWEKNIGCYKSFKKLDGHNSTVRSLCEISNEKLASSGDDKTIKIWDLSKFECTNTLVGHNGSVLTIIKVSDDVIATGSTDKCIKIWRISSSECVSKLEGDLGCVNCLCLLSDSILVSGGTSDHLGNNFILIWDLLSKKPFQVLVGHESSVYSIVKLNNGRIVSCSKDKTIRIWNIYNKEINLGF